MNTIARRRTPAYITVVAFIGAFLLALVFMLRQVGTDVPLVSKTPWKMSFLASDVKNLKTNSEVSISGVPVGTVTSLTHEGDHVRVTLGIKREYAPLKTGSTVRIGVKSLIGQSYVDVVDGKGADLHDGARLAAKDVIAPVDIDEVISTFDPKTRANLRGLIRSLGASTQDRTQSLDDMMTGLGYIGKDGSLILDALNDQSKDITSLVREATTLVQTLDEGQGQIVHVATQANTIVKSTADESDALKAAMKKFPGLVDSAGSATSDLKTLADALSPVASDLRKAAPGLDTSLRQLPSVSTDLRGTVAPLNKALEAAPATLQQIPAFSKDVATLIPQLDVLLSDVNPMLAYLKPYGRDIGAMFASFAATMDVPLENGVTAIRLAPVFNSASLRGNPLPLGFDPTHWLNPYPLPGTAGDPAPFRGNYPRVEQDPQ